MQLSTREAREVCQYAKLLGDPSKGAAFIAELNQAAANGILTAKSSGSQLGENAASVDGYLVISTAML